ncbi:MAG: asparagine synthase (glutamine-hydrolyzing) [Alphaproteobacteria bacterium]
MCGIAGLMRADGATPSSAALDALAGALAHRGPDGAGRYVGAGVGLVQTRLAIIDLATGDQPFFEPGGAALIANGEIYNYIELRAELQGVNFATQSDCELPLHLYRRLGLRYTSKLRGMYAIVIHDPEADRLVISRDPFGIKPLYYVENAEGFAFASEPAALIRAGFAQAALDPARRNELLQLQFTTGRDTLFAGIRRVLPGETLVVSHGRIVERHRQDALPQGRAVEIDEATALAKLDAVLEDSVRVHQRSDVPYGMFLSGGVDSSAILALMARLNTRPVLAYTAGFPESGARDERAHARKVAHRLGARHVEVEFGEEDFWSLLPEIAAAMDDPAADYAILPTYKLAREAKREVKVILCGEGGDELFGGYGRYRSVMRPWWRGGRTLRARGALEKLDILRADLAGWRDGIAAAEATESTAGRSRVQVAQAVDFADWMPHDLLTKLDRCLMAHGVEGRTPFLDPEVAKFAFRLPDGLKIRKGVGKYLLRRWLDAQVPEADAFSKKRGFTVPVARWIARRGSTLGPLVAASPAIAEICLPGRVEKLFREADDKRKGFAAWILLFYALWHRVHIEGVAPKGDVFESLAA